MADFNQLSLADIYSKAQAVRSGQQAEQMHNFQMQQLQNQQGVRDRLADFVTPDGSIDMQRAIPQLLKVGDYHSIAALAQIQKANKGAEAKPLRAPTPFEYESGSRGQATGHPVVDNLAQTPEGRAALGNILRGGSSSTYVQGQDENGNPAYVPMPSRPNAGGASPAPGVRPKYDPLSEMAIKGLTDHAANFSAISKAKDSFKDQFGGLGKGSDTLADASLTIGSKFPDKFGGADKDTINWWKNYRFHDQTFRHSIIGSAMTPQEMSMYDKTTITPSMDPDVIKSNLDRRFNVEKAVSNRFARTHMAGNFNPNQIREALGENADTLMAAPAAPKNNADAENWIQKAMKQNGGMNRQQIIAEGIKRGKVNQGYK